MRHALIGVLGLAWGWGAPALAQPCHEVAPAAAQEPSVDLGVALETATYRTPRYEGDYQALSLFAQGTHARGHVRLALPVYRLVRNGLEGRGLGDVALDAGVRLAQAAEGALATGLALAVTLPSGDASQELGMGHVMVMPGAWLDWRGARARVHARLAYGRALGGGAHLRGRPQPLVNPMNASEVEGSLGGAVQLTQEVGLKGGAYGALPVALPEGAARAATFAGLELRWRQVTLGFEGHLPLAGAPFQLKAVARLSLRF